MVIRREWVDDIAAIRAVHALAFRRDDDSSLPAEVALVDALRRSYAWMPKLSLVAVEGDVIVGHVVCTRAWLGSARRHVLGLAPIGVLPERQGRGFGQALMHTVLGAAEALDEPLVGVVGEPGFYQRFGFEPASRYAVEAPDASWGDFFQVRILSSCTSGLRGRFTYAPPFGL